MIKCEVIETCTIVCGKGSIVEISDTQYQIAKKFLKPLNTKEEVKGTNESEIETSKVEEKGKKTKKK